MVFFELYLLSVVSFICGFLVKLVDFFEDDLKLHKKYSVWVDFAGIFYGLIIAGVLFFWPALAPLAFGVILGEIVAKKIDAPAHIFGVIAFLIFVVLFSISGMVNFNLDIIVVFLFCIFLVASILDEKLDHYSESMKKNNLLKKILSFRLVLELSSIGVFLITLNPIYWVSIFSFDLAYIICSKNLPLIFNKKRVVLRRVR